MLSPMLEWSEEKQNGQYEISLYWGWRFSFTSKRSLNAFRGSSQKWLSQRLFSINHAFSEISSTIQKSYPFLTPRDMIDMNRERDAYYEVFNRLARRCAYKPTNYTGNHNYNIMGELISLHSYVIRLCNLSYDIAERKNITILKYEIGCQRDIVLSAIHNFRTFQEVSKQYELPAPREIDLPLLKVA